MTFTTLTNIAPLSTTFARRLRETLTSNDCESMNTQSARVDVEVMLYMTGQNKPTCPDETLRKLDVTVSEPS